MIAALIITAGKTSRRDRFEPQTEIGSIPVIQRIVKTFQWAGISRVVIVCDEDEDETKKLAAHLSAIFLHGNSKEEMFDNIKTGLAYLQDKCSGVLIGHAGVPLFSAETVHALAATEAGSAISIPTYEGNPGHPVFLRNDSFPAILAYEGDGGLAAAVKMSGIDSLYVEVDDEGILANIHYDNDFDQLLSRHFLAELHADIRIRIVREKAFYGPGAHQLLQLIDETSSLSEACRQMGISYSKGRSILATIEQQLGQTVTEGKAGGRHGGSSAVTESGKALMSIYTSFITEAKAQVQATFDKYFAGFSIDL